MKPANEQLKREQQDLQVQRAQKAQRMDTDTDTNIEINQALQARLAAHLQKKNRSVLILDGICIKEADIESIMTFLSTHQITSLSTYSRYRQVSEYDGMSMGGRIGRIRDEIYGGVTNIKAFLTALKDSQSLTRLDLGFINNIVMDDHVQAVATFLTDNRQLTHLSLAGKNMTDPAALILSGALKKNVTLTNLNLCPSIGTNGRSALKQAEDARNQPAEATRKALVENNNGEPQALLHDFHQRIPLPKVRSLIAAYNEVPRLTIKP